MSSTPVTRAGIAASEVEFCVEDVTYMYYAYVRFCCQSEDVRGILEGLSFHMILNQ